MCAAMPSRYTARAVLQRFVVDIVAITALRRGVCKAAVMLPMRAPYTLLVNIGRGQRNVDDTGQCS